MLEKFESMSELLYFKSEKARERNSVARNLIESALDNIDNLSPEYIARVITAAIALGDTTLLKFRNIYRNLIQKTRADTIKYTAELVKRAFAFDDLYATWLATNLPHLKEASVSLLADLSPKDYFDILYSTVTYLND